MATRSSVYAPRPVHHNGGYLERFTHDADGSNRQDDLAARNGGEGPVKNTIVQDPGNEQPFGTNETRRLITILPPGTYGLESATGGAVYLYSYEPGSLDLGKTSANGLRQVTGTADTAARRNIERTISNINQRNKEFYPRPALIPNPLAKRK